ncbi:MAG: hypothetical protein ACFCUS_11815 [Rubrimonas sp.]
MSRVAFLLLCAGLALGQPSASLADGAAHAFERPAPRARDAGFNRAVTLGAGFARAAMAPGTSATASANVVAVAQSGAGNTVMLQVRQSNTGAVAAGAALNGRLRLD